MDVTVQIVECFSVFSLFVCFYFFVLFFIAGGFWIHSRARVLFVSLCNIHFSVSVTFLFGSGVSSVFFFVRVVLSELVAFV